MNKSYYNLELDEIYKEFQTNPDVGLDEEEAKQRFIYYGPNELPKVSRGFIKIYLAPLL